MGTSTAQTARPPGDAETLYRRLEDRILARDQVGASGVYYDLLRADRPLKEIVGQAVRIHAPYTHVPYHERIDEGYVNFVNNDHCLLSARATLHLSARAAGQARRPADGADHLVHPHRPRYLEPEDQQDAGPLFARCEVRARRSAAAANLLAGPAAAAREGPLRERLDQWMTLVHRGQVIDAYRVFLGLMENQSERQDVLAELVFAGLIDLQDRAFLNRSYTTGHKSFRARATVELGNAVGWDRAHDVVYAGALDIGVGPRWYSTYEMASNAVKIHIDGESLHAVPYRGASEREAALLLNTGTLSAEEERALIDVVLRQPEPAFLEHLAKLLLAGKSPRRILDTIQVGAAQVILETQNNTELLAAAALLRILQHDGLVLRQLRAQAADQAAVHRRRLSEPRRLASEATGDLQPVTIKAPAAAASLSADAILDRVEAAVTALDGPGAVAWTQAYLDTGADATPADGSHRTGRDARWATIRTTRKSPSACLRIIRRTAPPGATGCCWRRRSTPPCTANTATRWKPAAASAKQWASPH